MHTKQKHEVVAGGPASNTQDIAPVHADYAPKPEQKKRWLLLVSLVAVIEVSDGLIPLPELSVTLA
jgi:hypothetical protein